MLIYVSSATAHFDKQALESILAVARANNEKLDVTGFLIHHDYTFFQILEGEEHVVDDLMGKISKDSRHQDIFILLKEHIEERDFADWSMGHATVTDEDIDLIPGLRKFFSAGATVIEDVKNEQVKKVLRSFKEGLWRRKIV